MVIYASSTHDIHLCCAFDVQSTCRVKEKLIHTLMLSSYRVLESSLDSLYSTRLTTSLISPLCIDQALDTKNADRLSCQFANAVLFKNRDLRGFQEAFALDPDLCTVRDCHAAHESGHRGDRRAAHAIPQDTDLLAVEKDLLYSTHNNERKLVVPPSHQESLMVEAHRDTTPGNVGVDRTLHR